MDFGVLIMGHLIGDYLLQNDWMALNKKGSTIPCVVHCLLYTGTMLLVMWMVGNVWPWWAFTVIFASHFIQDRTNIIPWFMSMIGQDQFRESFGPWSTVIVDNTFHLFFAFALWVGFENNYFQILENI